MIKKNNNLIKVTEKDMPLLESGEIWKDVTKIGRSAFEKINNLQEIEIPESVVEIDEYAFSGCENLKSVKLPSEIKVVKRGTFQNCSSLVDIEVPNKVEEIECEAFYNCEKLTKIKLPENVTLSCAVFGNCFMLEEVLTKSINTVGEFAFMNCRKLKKMPQQKSIHISEGEFAGCERLKDEITNRVRVVEKKAFCDCLGLTSLIIPESVVEIDDNAFCGCKNLSIVLIPDSVEEFGFDVFEGCDNLKFIFAGNKLKKMLPPPFKKKVIDLKSTPEKFLDLPSELFKDERLIKTLFDTIKFGIIEQVYERPRLFEEYKAYCLKVLRASTMKIKNPKLTAKDMEGIINPTEKSKFIKDIK